MNPHLLIGAITCVVVLFVCLFLGMTALGKGQKIYGKFWLTVAGIECFLLALIMWAQQNLVVYPN